MPPAPVTPDELRYFRFLLMQLGSIDSHPNPGEALWLQCAGKRPAPRGGPGTQRFLRQLRQSSRSVVPSAVGLSASDKAFFAGLVAQREQKILALTNRILTQVRPQTAARLRAPGKILAQKKP